MSDDLNIAIVWGVPTTAEVFYEDTYGDVGLEAFSAGNDNDEESFKGYVLGKSLAEFAYPEEFSAGFKIDSLEKTRDFVAQKLKELGIEEEPRLLLVSYVG
jgi:hypothetical protein